MSAASVTTGQKGEASNWTEHRDYQQLYILFYTTSDYRQTNMSWVFSHHILCQKTKKLVDSCVCHLIAYLLPAANAEAGDSVTHWPFENSVGYVCLTVHHRTHTQTTPTFSTATKTLYFCLTTCCTISTVCPPWKNLPRMQRTRAVRNTSTITVSLIYKSQADYKLAAELQKKTPSAVYGKRHRSYIFTGGNSR